MLTPEQEQWINGRSDTKKITVVPYDPRSEELYQKVATRIHKVLGPEAAVEHGGASSLGISGQDEIDVAIVAKREMIDVYIPKLEKEFGEVQSRYPDRARFAVVEDGKKIDLKIIDVGHESYKKEKIFNQYLRNHPDDLERYRILKEECNGFSVREYYRKKIEFINGIHEKIDGIRFERLSQERLEEALVIIGVTFPDSLAAVTDIYKTSLENNKEDEHWKTRRILEYWMAIDTVTNNIVGLTGFYQLTKHTTDEIWLGWYAVDPKVRGNGIGRKILEWTIGEARKRGYVYFRLWTTTDPGEAVAQKLYDSMGLNIYKKELDEKSGDTILFRELKL